MSRLQPTILTPCAAGYKLITDGSVVFVCLYWYSLDCSYTDALCSRLQISYKWVRSVCLISYFCWIFDMVTNGLQMEYKRVTYLVWNPKRFCVLPLIFVWFSKCRLPVQRVTNWLQTGYRFEVKSVGFSLFPFLFIWCSRCWSPVCVCGWGGRGYKWFTNRLQIWNVIHRCCLFSLIFIRCSRCWCPMQQVTNRLKIGYQIEVDSIRVIYFYRYVFDFQDVDAPWSGLQMGYKWVTDSKWTSLLLFVFAIWDSMFGLSCKVQDRRHGFPPLSENICRFWCSMPNRDKTYPKQCKWIQKGTKTRQSTFEGTLAEQGWTSIEPERSTNPNRSQKERIVTIERKVAKL